MMKQVSQLTLFGPTPHPGHLQFSTGMRETDFIICNSNYANWTDDEIS